MIHFKWCDFIKVTTMYSRLEREVSIVSGEEKEVHEVRAECMKVLNS